MMTDVNNFQYVREHVREVPDFPKKGILFLDVTTIVLSRTVQLASCTL